MQNLFIKSFVNPFVDIALKCFNRLFNLFFYLTFSSFLSKSVLFTKLAISFLVVKFSSLSLAVKRCDVNLLSS